MVDETEERCGKRKFKESEFINRFKIIREGCHNRSRKIIALGTAVTKLQGPDPELSSSAAQAENDS